MAHGDGVVRISNRPDPASRRHLLWSAEPVEQRVLRRILELVHDIERQIADVEFRNDQIFIAYLRETIESGKPWDLDHLLEIDLEWMSVVPRMTHVLERLHPVARLVRTVLSDD